MLEVRDLSVSHGEIRAVDAVSLEVNEGEIVSIIGANGAGKTSLLNAICGIVRPKSGDIIFEGQAITGLASHQVFGRGIVQVPEGRMIFGSLSVAENLAIAAHRQNGFFLTKRSPHKLRELLPALADRFDQPASNLSGGEAQMLALARGLESNPKLLLLDEPSLGLSPKAAEQLFDRIYRLREEGMTILLVEQNVRQALALAGRGYVLEHGRIAVEGPAEELMRSDLILSTYLGVTGGI